MNSISGTAEERRKNEMTLSEEKIEQYREGFLEFHEIESFLSISERFSLVGEIPGRIAEIEKTRETNRTRIDDELEHIERLEESIRESRKLIGRIIRRQEDLEAQTNELSKIHSTYSGLLKSEG